MPQELEIRISGDEIEADWWTKDIGEIFCDLCSDKNTDKCQGCVTANPWCG